MNFINYNLKMVLPDKYDICEQLTLLQTKVQEKYGEKLFNL